MLKIKKKKEEVLHTQVSQPQNAGMYDPREAKKKQFPTVKGKFPFIKKNLPSTLIHPPANPQQWRFKPFARATRSALVNSTFQQKRREPRVDLCFPKVMVKSKRVKFYLIYLKHYIST